MTEVEKGKRDVEQINQLKANSFEGNKTGRTNIFWTICCLPAEESEQNMLNLQQDVEYTNTHLHIPVSWI